MENNFTNDSEVKNQNNIKPKKKNGCLKIFLIGIGVIFFLGIIGSIFGNDDSKKSDIKKVQKEIIWTNLKTNEKQEILNNLINSKEEPYNVHRFKLTQSLLEAAKSSTKFPDTFEYLSTDGEWYNDQTHFWLSDKNTKIIDTENGIFEVKFDYRAENKLGMKVRQSITAKYKYDGKLFSIVDVKDN